MTSCTYVVYHHAFSLIEPNSEGPLLPFDHFSSLSRMCDGEAGALWLDHMQRFDIFPQFLVFRDVLAGWLYFEGLRLFGGVVCTSRKLINPNHLPRHRIHYR